MSTAQLERPDPVPPELPPARGRGGASSGTLRRFFPWVFTALVIVVVSAPVVSVLVQGFNVSPVAGDYKLGLDSWRHVWAVPGMWDALENTVKLVIIRNTIALAMAILVAWLLARTNVPGAGIIEFFCWVSFFMPPLAVIQGWILLAGGNSGVLNLWIHHIPGLGSVVFDVYSFWGIVWVHLMSTNISTLVVLLLPAFRFMDRSLEDAAATSGAGGFRIFGRVFIPIMRPVLLFLLVYGLIKALQSYDVERVLGTPAGIDVYATMLINMVTSAPPFIPEGSALSAIVLLVLIPLIIMQRRFSRGQFTTISGHVRRSRVDLGRLKIPVAVFLWMLIVLLVGVPIVGTVVGSFMTRVGYFNIPKPWTMSNWNAVLHDDALRGAFVTTIKYGVIAGIFGALIMFMLAYIVVRIEFSGRGVLDFASWLPWAVPGVLLSLGISTAVLNISWMRFLYNSGAIVIVAIILYALPVGSQLIKTSLMQLRIDLEEAGQMSGATWLRVQLKIVRPLVMPSLVASGLVVFGVALGEVSGILLLAPTDTQTLALLTLRYQTDGQLEAAGVSGTLMVILAAFVATASGLARRRLNRMGES